MKLGDPKTNMDAVKLQYSRNKGDIRNAGPGSSGSGLEIQARARKIAATQIAAEDTTTTERVEASWAYLRNLVEESEQAAKKLTGILERGRAWRRLAGERKRAEEQNQLEKKLEKKEKGSKGGGSQEDEPREEEREKERTYL